jgi:hypothetical protein
MCHVGSLDATYQVGSRIFTPFKKKILGRLLITLLITKCFLNYLPTLALMLVTPLRSGSPKAIEIGPIKLNCPSNFKNIKN